MDYSYEYTSLETSSSSGGMVVYMILMLAISVFAIVSMWKVFKKAGKEGWAALIPIYNLVVLFQKPGFLYTLQFDLSDHHILLHIRCRLFHFYLFFRMK